MDEKYPDNQASSAPGVSPPDSFAAAQPPNQPQPYSQQPYAQAQQYQPQPPAPAPQAVTQTPMYPQQSANFAYPQNQAMQTSQDLQNSIRNKILKIILVLSALSLAVVGLVFLLNSSSDPSLSATAEASNSQAVFVVPTAWGSTETETYNAYFNQESLQASQATMVVIKPVRVSFDTKIISDSERRKIADDYKREVNDEEANIRLGARSDVTADGFEAGFEYVIEGIGEDGTTALRGLSRVLFDEQNFAHTIEFVAVQSYWDANEAQIVEILNSYQLKDSE